VIAGGVKFQAAFLGAKNKPDRHACPAFEIVSAKAANAQTGMKMRLPKTVPDCIDGSRHLVAARFRKLPNVPPERF
jgi:hypothetical protein